MTSAIAGYKIVRPLGAGGMGQVFLVEHPRLPRRDALKLRPVALSRSDDFTARFAREADLLAQLSHPNIVTVYDRGEHDGSLWIAMEFVDGTDAGALVQSRGPLPVDLVLPLIAGAGAALDYAWRTQKVTHRDVKPGNILVSWDRDANPPELDAVKLADFGIAKAAEESTSLTATGMTIGTMSYISPEAIDGSPVDNRSDIYSLACTAYHLLAGRPPFTETSISALMAAHLHRPVPPISTVAPHVPAGWDAVFARALAKDPASRYGACAEFVAALSAAAQPSAVPAGGPAYSPTLVGSAPAVRHAHTTTTGRSQWLLPGAVIVAAIALVAAGTFVFRSGQSDNSASTVAAPSSTHTVTTTTTPSTPTVQAQTPTETVTVPVTPAPVEGQPCGADQFDDYSDDGTLYCSALNEAWTDLTHKSRPAVEPGSSCDEPGARAQIARTEAIGTCRTGPGGTLIWDW
ncbi:serine/threonine protein kinase [Gordonia alkaliphila]|uniref:serine/threonine-protein kinase n=1 Tax=Gordonia alkaliphila TaxID=1053547 RepID=UPI001FF5A05F|nr:serine/threonine-protein kinase [Gordonia alkaliphila]MCK0439087.1 serine/threonine protein kinase [Gordonia alkaliphila]